MKAYSLEEFGSARVIYINPKDLQRFRFYHYIDGEKTRIKFRNKSKTVAAGLAFGKVVVYTKPHPAIFHREFMRQDGLAKYRGLAGCDEERLVENMMECAEVV